MTGQILGRFISWSIIFVISVTSIFFFILNLTVWLLTVLVDRRLVILQQLTCFWGSFYTYIMPTWRIRVEGRNNIRRGACYMMVCNHQSQLDILVNFRLYVHYKFVSKAEIFKVPFIGWNMYLNRYIRLVRGDKSQTDQMMTDCEKALDGGSSVFFFPEGTRSKDGNIKDFKPGAFLLAKKKEVPILPIVLNGTSDALPKYSMKTAGVHRIRVRALPEIPYEEFKDLSVEETIELVRNTMIEGLDSLKADMQEG